MCALFCVPLRAAPVEKKKLVVTMDLQAACACSRVYYATQSKNGVLWACNMCALFCVPLRAAPAGKKKLVVTMNLQAACACSGAPPTKAPT